MLTMPNLLLMSSALRRGGGANIFVSSLNGDDGNDGSSAAQSLASLSAAETAALAHGDGVWLSFEYGSEWSETMDLSSLDRVRTTAHGDSGGGLPMMRGDRAVTETWSSAGTNLWAATLPWAANGYPLLFNPAGTAMTFVAGTPAATGQFTISAGAGVINSATNSTLTVTVYSTTDPTGAGYSQTHLAAPRFGTNGSTVGASISQIRFSRFGSRNGVQVGDQTLFDRCLFDGHTTHDALPSSGEYRDCHSEHDIDDSRESSIGLEFFRDDGAGHTVKWTRCTARGRAGATQIFDAIGGHVGAGARYDGAECIDCSVQNGSILITGMAGTNSLTRPHVVDGRIQTDGATSNTLTDPWLEGTVLTPVSCTNAPTVVEGLRTPDDHATGAIVGFNGGLTLRRSVFARDGSAFQSNGPWDTSDGVLTEMTGCIFGAATWGRQAACATLGSSDNNVFATNFAFEVGGVNRTSLAAHRSATGQDANSVNTDPQLADPANGDFRALASGLPDDCGLERDPTCQLYTPIPADIAAAEARLLAA